MVSLVIGREVVDGQLHNRMSVISVNDAAGEIGGWLCGGDKIAVNSTKLTRPAGSKPWPNRRIWTGRKSPQRNIPGENDSNWTTTEFSQNGHRPYWKVTSFIHQSNLVREKKNGIHYENLYKSEYVGIDCLVPRTCCSSVQMDWASAQRIFPDRDMPG